jgi:TM2 domain-containing membrane protein YozV
MNTNPPPTDNQMLEIDLRDPSLAALFAWLIPGAGHLYQRRTGKGLLFMICILSIYFFGLALGEGKVVYASWNQVDRRWQFPLQAGVGLPAIPAIVQNMTVRRGNPPILGGIMAPPKNTEELADWHYTLGQRFDIGTLYTMVAGLLNILAIWDAYGGPVLSEPGNKPERGPPDDDKKK